MKRIQYSLKTALLVGIPGTLVGGALLFDNLFQLGPFWSAVACYLTCFVLGFVYLIIVYDEEEEEFWL